MTEILFYHLTESVLDDALPPLLEKSLERGWRVVVQTASDDRRDALNAHLWTYRDDSFLAHGSDGESHAALQPVLLTTTQDSPNGANVRFLVEGAEPGDVSGFERVVIMFDGHDPDQLEKARAAWKRLRDEGHAATYWQQSADRRWEKRA